MRQKARKIKPLKLVLQLLRILPQKRTRDIIIKRFGLSEAKKKTLEEIGHIYGITRERVRQIEEAALSELKNSKKIALLLPFERAVENLLERHGGIMEANNLMNFFSQEMDLQEQVQQNAFEFGLKLSDKFVEYKENESLKKAWGKRDMTLRIPKKVIDIIFNILEKTKKPFSEDQVLDVISQHNSFKKLPTALQNRQAILSYLSLSKRILKNPYNEWGISSWTEIIPKGVKDKAYIVLKKAGKPLHFQKITDFINEIKFSEKKANVQTVHNELIKDPRFVLVGRGIYALSEWGYKLGTVTDVIAAVLKEANSPLSRDEIVNKVLKQRIVKKNTIILALQARNRFQRVSEKVYKLIDETKD